MFLSLCSSTDRLESSTVSTSTCLAYRACHTAQEVLVAVITATIYKGITSSEWSCAFPVQVCSCIHYRTHLPFLQDTAASISRENHLLVPPSLFHSFPFSGCRNSDLRQGTHSLSAYGAVRSGIQNTTGTKCATLCLGSLSQQGAATAVEWDGAGLRGLGCRRPGGTCHAPRVGVEESC